MSTIDVDSIAAHSDEQIETKTTLNIPTSTQTIKQKKKKYKTAYIKANDLNLRKKANVKSKSIKRLFYGKKIEFIIINKKWSKIKVDNKVGYVQTKYITTKKIKSNTKNTNKYKNDKSPIYNRLIYNTIY